MNFLEFRAWFDERFAILLHQKSDSFTSKSNSPDVAKIISYVAVISQGGKRFRPFLIYKASNLNREDAEKHLLLFASVELLHIFALIHDDIMDEADTRHGVVSAHKKFADQYGDSTAESIGILLGDIVFAWVYECLFDYTREFPDLKDRIAEEFARLVSEVTHGQILDVLSPAQSPLDERAITEKMVLKTARYSFVQPMRLGFVVAGDNLAGLSFAEAFGLSLGIGFQLQDDLLDSTLSTETGKTPLVDIQTGQQTLLSWYMQNKATANEREEFLTFWGSKDLSESAKNRLVELLNTSGAVEYIKIQSENYFEEAEQVIKVNAIQNADTWQDVLSLVKDRKK
ncbi:MAG: hypothetical protein RL641_456 [Candidatus Parcubacteria bacterium]|jgi:geranylgeranyl diphosphate synthase type I